ncbi:hypothetical protein B0A48_05896 [Cryoendolithus antarcticus]|uniref:FAD-binding domain-containing protein n=1 Tax=Cryoendolithus antarcticus TaxID=1507870 RepID=A0A1V8TCA8_9PEZI|nr:hypothetical protein B0A48_05896 [Cryoendolithus antarcticus]
MSSPAPLRVAITGAGPAGLGAVIALSQLPGVEVEVYERATELREKWTYRRARGQAVDAELIVGGDGIRSAVRDAVYPNHTTRFTGTIIWRTLIPWPRVKHLPEITETTTWWYGKDGHVYTSPVDDPEELCDEERMLEISCRNLVDPATDSTTRFSWSVPATNERVDYDPQVRGAMAVAPEGTWKEFSAFAGARLDKLKGMGQSCPAGRCQPSSLWYEFLDEQKQKAQAVEGRDPEQCFTAALSLRADGLNMESKMPWIYMNDIVHVWKQWVAKHEEVVRPEGRNSMGEQGTVLLDDLRTAITEVSITA